MQNIFWIASSTELCQNTILKIQNTILFQLSKYKVPKYYIAFQTEIQYSIPTRKYFNGIQNTFCISNTFEVFYYHTTKYTSNLKIVRNTIPLLGL